jgi:hypothetical protein
MYGGILAFTFEYLGDLINCNNYCTALVYTFITFLLSCLWIYHSVTLRAQYYRTRWKVEKLEIKIGIKKIKNKDFNWEKTRPYESKLSEILLVLGLFLISNGLMLYVLKPFILCLIIIGALIVISSVSLFFAWRKIDQRRLSKIHKEVF